MLPQNLKIKFKNIFDELMFEYSNLGFLLRINYIKSLLLETGRVE